MIAFAKNKKKLCKVSRVLLAIDPHSCEVCILHFCNTVDEAQEYCNNQPWFAYSMYASFELSVGFTVLQDNIEHWLLTLAVNQSQMACLATQTVEAICRRMKEKGYYL